MVFTNTEVLHVTSTAADVFYGISALLIFFGCLNILSSGYDLADRYRILSRTRDAYKVFSASFARPTDKYPAWGLVPFEVKMAFFTMWSVSEMVGSCLITNYPKTFDFHQVVVTLEVTPYYISEIMCRIRVFGGWTGVPMGDFLWKELDSEHVHSRDGNGDLHHVREHDQIPRIQ